VLAATGDCPSHPTDLDRAVFLAAEGGTHVDRLLSERAVARAVTALRQRLESLQLVRGLTAGRALLLAAIALFLLGAARFLAGADRAGPARTTKGECGNIQGMDLGLADRVYVLTGASRGLGFATAQALVADGARVVVSSRDADRVTAAVEHLGGPAHAVGMIADLAEPTTADRLARAAHDSFGRLDGALISVGGPPPGTAAQATDDQWRQAFESIFLGMVRMARTVAGALTDGGAIALVLSASARNPITGLGLSNGLRPGLVGAAKDMADEFGPLGIRVVSLLPFRILTDRSQELFMTADDPDAARVRAEAEIPLRRIGDPAEFGRVAAFVLSPAASYLSGLSIPVDGGAVRTL
jgi:3-oxoacyl-[acyl-carrier protein] reductase